MSASSGSGDNGSGRSAEKGLTCGDCRWFRAQEDKAGKVVRDGEGHLQGSCHARPPQVIVLPSGGGVLVGRQAVRKLGVHGFFPPVRSDMFCGLHPGRGAQVAEDVDGESVKLSERSSPEWRK